MAGLGPPYDKLQPIVSRPNHAPMNTHRWLGVALALSAGTAFAAPAQCDLSAITGSRELHQALGLRTVELVRRAAGTHGDLASLVDPSANFSLGAGDVGRPLGTGAAGARQLAELMNADTYRFLGWDYMDLPVNACSRQKIEVEFIDSQAKALSRVEFDFEEGRVVGAAGWQRSFESGRIGDAPAP